MAAAGFATMMISICTRQSPQELGATHAEVYAAGLKALGGKQIV